MDLTPEEATEEWKSEVASYPEKWIVGSAPQIGDFMDIKGEPLFMLFDSQGLIRMKSYQVDDILKLVVQ